MFLLDLSVRLAALKKGLQISPQERRKLEYIEQSIKGENPQLYRDPARVRARQKGMPESRTTWKRLTADKGQKKPSVSSRALGYMAGPSGAMDLRELAQTAADNKMDCIELTTWGHGGLDPVMAATNPEYGPKVLEFLKEETGNKDFFVSAVSGHLVGQGLYGRLTRALRKIMPGDISKIRGKAAFRAKCKERFVEIAKAAKSVGAPVMTGFMGEGQPLGEEGSIWDIIAYDFPPKNIDELLLFYAMIGKDFRPVLDQIAEGTDGKVKFALEKHSTEPGVGVADGDFLMAALDDHTSFGFNFDPSHLIWRGIDAQEDIRINGKRILHVHAKDVESTLYPTAQGNTRILNWKSPDTGYRFTTCGSGDVKFKELVTVLNEIDYRGPWSIEHEKDGFDFRKELAKAAAHIRDVDEYWGDGFEASMKAASGGSSKGKKKSGSDENLTVAQIIGLDGNPVSVSVPSDAPVTKK